MTVPPMSGHWPSGQPNQSYIDEERGRLVRAHFENACGDYGCMRRRLDAAIAVLTGWPKGHADIAIAVELWQEEVMATVEDQPGPLRSIGRGGARRVNVQRRAA